jgi:zinc protease
MTSSGRIERRTLDNGLTVVSESRGLGPVVFSGVVYRVGSRDERPGITGISHILEHMMFKGTEKYGKGEVAGIVERNGGDLNAFTSEDVTMYYEVFARDRWKLALEIESERMANLKIDAGELESERAVILEERAMYLDIPAIELSEELLAASFRESPYRWPIIGWEADIRAITRHDLMDHYGTYYSPENAALIVVGDVEPGEVFVAAEEYFGSIPRVAPAERRIPKEPDLRATTRVELTRPSNLPLLQVLLRAPEIRSRDSEALSLLANVLSGTRTSRLDLALLETNKAGDAHVQYYPKADPGTFTIAVEGQPGVGHDELEEIVWGELERLRTSEIEQEELERALNQVEAHHVFAMQSPSNRGFVLGWHEAQGEVEYADRIVDRLRSLTAAELREAAGRYFQRDHSGVARLTPAGGNGGGLGAAAVAGGVTTGSSVARRLVVPGVGAARFRTGLAKSAVVRRLQLDNGMRITLQADHTDALVAVSLLFHAGARFDPVDKQGLSNLTADTLERGTAALPFVEFSRGFERIGSNFTLGTGSEAVHGNSTFLSRHFETGLDLIADLLHDPGFRDSDLETVRALARNDLEAREDDLDDVAEDMFFRGVAGEHPYGRLPHGTHEGLAAVEVGDLREFHARAYRPDETHVAIVGDFDENRVESMLAARFGIPAAPDGAVETTLPLAAPADDLVLVKTRPDKAQAKIFFGGPGIAASDDDRVAAIVMNHVLGGSAIRSRLGDEIRDNQGLAYSVTSRNYERSHGGFFFVHMGTRPDNVPRAVEAIRTELRRIEEGVTATELEDAQNYLTGSFPLRFTTYGRLARFWTRSSFYGWPDDYLATYVDRVRAVSGDDVRGAAARLVATARVLAVAGPVDEGLRPVGGAT